MYGYGMNPNPPDSDSMYCHCERLDCELCWEDLRERGLAGCCDGCCERRLLAVELVTFADGDAVGCGKGPARLCRQCRSCSVCRDPLTTLDDFCAGKCDSCRNPKTPLAGLLVASIEEARRAKAC